MRSWGREAKILIVILKVFSSLDWERWWSTARQASHACAGTYPEWFTLLRISFHSKTTLLETQKKPESLRIIHMFKISQYFMSSYRFVYIYIYIFTGEETLWVACGAFTVTSDGRLRVMMAHLQDSWVNLTKKRSYYTPKSKEKQFRCEEMYLNA